MCSLNFYRGPFKVATKYVARFLAFQLGRVIGTQPPQRMKHTCGRSGGCSAGMIMGLFHNSPLPGDRKSFVYRAYHVQPQPSHVVSRRAGRIRRPPTHTAQTLRDCSAISIALLVLKSRLHRVPRHSGAPRELFHGRRQVSSGATCTMRLGFTCLALFGALSDLMYNCTAAVKVSEYPRNALLQRGSRHSVLVAPRSGAGSRGRAGFGVAQPKIPC